MAGQAGIAEINISLTDFLRGKISQNNQAVPSLSAIKIAGNTTKL